MSQSADLSLVESRSIENIAATAYCTFNGHVFLFNHFENAEIMENFP